VTGDGIPPAAYLAAAGFVARNFIPSHRIGRVRPSDSTIWRCNSNRPPVTRLSHKQTGLTPTKALAQPSKGNFAWQSSVNWKELGVPLASRGERKGTASRNGEMGLRGVIRLPWHFRGLETTQSCGAYPSGGPSALSGGISFNAGVFAPDR